MAVSPPVDIQPIKNALVGVLNSIVFPHAINGFSTWATPVTRKLQMWNRVDPTNQPTAFLVQHNERYETLRTGTPALRYLDLGLWCYGPTGESVLGDDILDSLTYGVETVMQPDNPQTNEYTIGGLVHWCRINRGSGLYIRDPGDIDGQALLVLPIVILVP